MEVESLIKGTTKLCRTVPLAHPPLAFYYADAVPAGTELPSGERTCIVALMMQARGGATVAAHRERFGCGGAGYYLGFCEPRPGIAEFVSTGIPGVMEGERYKQSPELVEAYMEQNPVGPAPAEYAVIRPVADLSEAHRPEVIVYIGRADELAALVGLANYARRDDAVICPFGSGCNGALNRPLREAQREEPRAVLGLFDPSARPYVGGDELSFAAPVALWEEMVGNAAESFLSTPTWEHLRRRIGSSSGETG